MLANILYILAFPKGGCLMNVSRGQSGDNKEKMFNPGVFVFSCRAFRLHSRGQILKVLQDSAGSGMFLSCWMFAASMWSF